ncbi:glycosyltransferase [Bacillus sp. UNCCL81]|uniref:glycosyltransferase n=1 Tax=Bacillus sp. UNCCL81 TaxID=1502755 RepID=UPI0008E483E0|nr:glycosyltransferase [Bacillus sp. UNCCL81]SFD10614.1 Glycosyltransferase involved in cell wall bisynthesis [Bacillus sp. UNCCL81]
MNKKVCAFVFNHFTNDARVLRECSALAEVGYDVDLIALHDDSKELPKRERMEEGFNVIRVNNRLPFGIYHLVHYCAKIFNLVKSSLLMKLVAILLILLGLFLNAVATIIIAAVIVLFGNRYMKVLLTRGYNILQMIYHGLKRDYDIYHANDLNTLPQGIICAKVFKKSKLVYDSHEVQSSRSGYENPIFGKIEKFLIKYIDVMIHENNTRAKYTQDLYDIDYPEVIHNYPFVSKPEESKAINLHEKLGISEDEPILLYQGGIQKGRGLELIVKAAPLYKRGIVVFIGDGKIKPTLLNLVEELQLQNRVKFIDKVPVDELLNYTRNAYLGFQVLNNINFNHYSASSNKLFEYMMSGVPVVACSFPEIQKVVEGEYTGVCVDSHDIDSIAEGVNYLLDNPEVRDEMSKNCLKARHKYNWNNEKKVFIGIYEKVLYGEKATMVS